MTPLPWPIPSEGFDVEVARWYYEPTERRNGGEWIYLIRCTLDRELFTPAKTGLLLNAWRVREDYITKRCFDREFACSGPDVEVALKSKRFPPGSAREFEKFLVVVREKAEKDRARYERAVEVYQ